MKLRLPIFVLVLASQTSSAMEAANHDPAQASASCVVDLSSVAIRVEPLVAKAMQTFKAGDTLMVSFRFGQGGGEPQQNAVMGALRKLGIAENQLEKGMYRRDGKTPVVRVQLNSANDVRLLQTLVRGNGSVGAAKSTADVGMSSDFVSSMVTVKMAPEIVKALDKMPGGEQVVLQIQTPTRPSDEDFVLRQDLIAVQEDFEAAGLARDKIQSGITESIPSVVSIYVYLQTEVDRDAFLKAFAASKTVTGAKLIKSGKI